MIPFKPADEVLSMLIPVAVTLIVMIAAAFVVLKFGKQRIIASGARRMKVVERLSLSRRSALLLVECDGRTLLVGQAGDRLSLLETKQSE